MPVNDAEEKAAKKTVRRGRLKLWGADDCRSKGALLKDKFELSGLNRFGQALWLFK